GVEGGYGDVIEAGFLVGIAVDSAGRFYGLDGWWGALVQSAALPSLTLPVRSRKTPPGATTAFSASAVGEPPLRFQWFKDGIALAGATDSVLTIVAAQPADLGDYRVRVTNAVGSVMSNAASLRFATAEENGLTDFFAAALAGADSQALIVGFVLDE